MGDPIWQWSATRVAAAVRGGEVSAEEVAEANVARMREANPAINAVVADMGDEAIARAREVDAARRRGEPLDILAGVPVTLKVNVDLPGRPNSNGVPALANHVAEAPSPVVANLLGAGAVCLGQTNTPEFSMRGHTDNPLHGETLNPWDAAITAGGSSGGAAAATAAGIGCIGHGNDIAGSLRWPAHCCGLATIKPTQGRIPAFNPSAGAERPFIAQMFSSQGPLARTVADVRLGLAAMARRDPRDPFQVPAPLEGPEVPRKAALAKIPAGIEADPEIVALIRAAADHLSNAGWQVEEVEVPDIEGAWRLSADLLFNELDATQIDDWLPKASEDFARVWRGYKSYVPDLDLKAYMAAQAERATRIRDWALFLEEWPAVVCPVTVARTPPRGYDVTEGADLRRIMGNDMAFTGAMNMLGLPGASVPAGMLDGAPVGVQIVAGRYREDVALAAAEAIEAGVGVMTERLWARGAA